MTRVLEAAIVIFFFKKFFTACFSLEGMTELLMTNTTALPVGVSPVIIFSVAASWSIHREQLPRRPVLNWKRNHRRKHTYLPPRIDSKAPLYLNTIIYTFDKQNVTMP